MPCVVICLDVYILTCSDRLSLVTCVPCRCARCCAGLAKLCSGVEIAGMQCFCSVASKMVLNMIVGHAQKPVYKASLQKRCIPQTFELPTTISEPERCDI